MAIDFDGWLDLRKLQIRQSKSLIENRELLIAADAKLELIDEMLCLFTNANDADKIESKIGATELFEDKSEE